MLTKPIGKNSMAQQEGYDLNTLISWLEDMRENELEHAPTGGKSRYRRRAELFSDAVDQIVAASEM